MKAARAVLFRQILFVSAVACGLLMVVTSAARAEMTLKIEASQSEYLIAEPLYVVCSVENRGTRDEGLFIALHPGAKILGFETVFPSGETRSCKPWMAIDYRSRTARRVFAPKESYSGIVDLTYEMGKEKWIPLLSQAGEYKLQATYTLDERTAGGPLSLSSDKIALTVKEPTGADKWAYDILTQSEAAQKYGIWSAHSQQAQAYARVIRDFPTSQYAGYARFYLAQVYELEGMMDPLRGTKEGDARLLEAANLFEKAAAAQPDMPMGVHALRMAGRCFAKAGDRTRAMTALEAALLAPAATDADREEARIWMGLVENGTFRREQVAQSFSESTGIMQDESEEMIALSAFRPNLEAAGFTITWDAANHRAMAAAGAFEVAIKPDSDLIWIAGREIKMKKAAELTDGHLYIPTETMEEILESYRHPGAPPK